MSQKHAPDIRPLYNGDADWDSFQYPDYLWSYEKVIPGDKAITAGFIRTVLKHAQLRKRLAAAKQALDACVGGVPRTAGLLAPLLHPDARLLLADIGGPGLAATRQVITDVKAGKLGIWKQHQADMARHSPRWATAIQDACSRSDVAELSIFNLPSHTFDVIATSFGPESLTDDPDEYKQAIDTWLQAGKPGAVAVMSYVVGSDGYHVNGRRFPATPVEPHTVEGILSPNMNILEHLVIPNSGDIRKPNDPTGFAALGLVVGTLTIP